MPEWMAVGALYWRTGRGPNMGEKQPCADLARNFPQVPVVPRRLDALEHRGFDALAVPANPEAVAVGCGGAHAGVEALVNDRVLRFEEQLLGEDWVSGIGHPSTHVLSEAPPKRRRHHPSWGKMPAAPIHGFDHPRRVMQTFAVLSRCGRSQEAAMTTTDPSVPTPFTSEDFAARMRRVVDSAAEKGLAGVIVTPGPASVWLIGYQPTAITERLTMLVLSTDNEPTLVVPILERPDAESAEGAGSVSLVDWRDGSDPYEIASPLLRSDGEFGISDSAWAMHVLGLQRALPQSSYRSLTECLPMMRAVKDNNELMRLAAAGAAADSAYGEIVQKRFAGRRETDVAADLADLLRSFGHEQVDFTTRRSNSEATPAYSMGCR